MTRRLIIIGAGGAALEALWICQRLNMAGAAPRFDVMGLADDNAARSSSTIEGFPILGTSEQVARQFGAQGIHFHCAIGDNRTRQRISLALEAEGLLPIALVDPGAVVAESATIGAGSYLAAHAFVGPEARIGRHALINVGASVGHHAAVGDFAQICPGARLSGHVRFGELAFIGSNGVVAPGVSVGDGALVGAGSFAARDVPAHATAVGVPAKVLAVPARPTLNS